jgi:hypothetical protein
MARRETEAERLRRCRLTFQRALQDGVPMEVAKVRVEIDEIRSRAAARSRRPASDQAEAQPRFYWQQGQYA